MLIKFIHNRPPLATQTLIALPIVYLFVVVIGLNNNVLHFLTLSALLVLAMGAVLAQQKAKTGLKFAHWLTGLSAIGLGASMSLVIEKITLLSSPGEIASCSLNPIVACSPVIDSAQASVLGFDNPIIGIFAFTALFTAGMTLLAGARKLHKLWWFTLFAATAAGALFALWLLYQALYVIAALCLYCMSVWLVSLPIFFMVFSQMIEHKLLPRNSLTKHFVQPLRATIVGDLLVIALVFVRWPDVWLSLM